MDNEPNDWEPAEEEQAPEHLQKKWDDEEVNQALGEDFAPCAFCGKLISRKSFSCIYCGETVFIESGVIGKLAAALKKGNLLIVIVAITIFSFIVLSMF